MHLKRIIALLASASIGLAACTVSTRPTLPIDSLLTPAAPPPPAQDGESAPLNPPDAANGAVIFAEKCAACHGPTGAGDGLRAEQIRAQGQQVANLIDPVRIRTAEPSDWHDLITNGRLQNLMPGFSGSLNAQERWDVQAYVWALGTSTQTLQAGQTLFQAKCASCHGPSGAQVLGDAQLALSSGRFLADRSLLDIANGMTQGDAHTDIALSEDERFQIADFVRTLAYTHVDPVEAKKARTVGDGTIVLRAVNGTQGGAVIGGLPVVLRAYDSASEVLSRTAELDAAGIVTFTELPRREDFFYQAELDYADGRFYASPAQFVTATQVISGVLPAFDTTTDPRDISIGEMHFFVQDVGEDTVTIVEYYLFDNAGDKAFIGEPAGDGRRHTLRLSAPKDAQNLRFDGLGLGQRFFQEGDVIFDTDVTVPGARSQQVAMIYELPYNGQFNFERTMFYPVRQWDVLTPEITGPGTPFAVSGLTDRGLQQTGAGNLFLHVGEPVAQPGGTLRFGLSGQPLGAAPPGADPLAIGLGLIALGLTIGAAYFLATRVRAMRTEAAASLPAQREALLREIAALDDAFAAGRIKEAKYLRQRDALMAELKAVWEPA